MPDDSEAPAAAVSAEARRLMNKLRLASWDAGSRPFEQQSETIKRDLAAENAAERALLAHIAKLEAEVARLREALEPFVRADRAIGAEPGPFRFETANGYRLIEREHLRAAGLAARKALAVQERPDA